MLPKVWLKLDISITSVQSAFQHFGNEIPIRCAKAAQGGVERKPDLISKTLIYGCPVNKVACKGAGAEYFWISIKW